MTFKEAFDSGMRFIEDDQTDMSIWWKKIDNDTFSVLFNDKIYGNHNIYDEGVLWVYNKSYTIHPDDLKIIEYNNKLNKIINE